MGELGRARALLLDRDGVINIDHGYVHTRDQFEFRPGIVKLTRLAQDLGYRVIVITNQSGIARGYYTEAQFCDLTAWMRGEFARRGADIAAVYHCPYHRAGTGNGFDRDSFWRKPNPGMILEAAGAFGLHLGRSIFLGDQPTDMAAARAAAVGIRVLLGQAGTQAGAAADADLVVSEIDEFTRRLPPLAALTCRD
ncbi:MAG TPA: HAD family hydrolase [Azospirillaceae bacterium]|nr:HAD family hydrolase [Azospirillaceae bacterium]